MSIEDNGPESAYPGPAEPGSEEEVYPDTDADDDEDEPDREDDPDMPVNPPVDEAEEPSPGSSA